MNSGDIAHERVLHRVLKENVERYGNREFFRFRDQVYGYKDFDYESVT